MSREGTTHELLPWYVNGTLSAEEEGLFREHMHGCSSCRKEIGALEAARSEILAHGEGYFEPHPVPEKLVEAVQGRLPAGESHGIYRHIALCLRCSAEARWVLGETAEGPTAAGSREAAGRPGAWTRGLALAAAAAAVLAAGAALYLQSGSGPPPVMAVENVKFIDSTVRSGRLPAIQVSPRAGGFILFLKADLAPEHLPVAITIFNSNGQEVHRETYSEPLYRDSYVVLFASRSTFPDGEYATTIRSLKRVGDPGLHYGFRVETAGD